MEVLDMINLQEELTFLKLNKTYELLQELENANKLTSDILEFVTEMCKVERMDKDERAKNAVVRVANFPSLKTIDEFDFNFQPTLNKVKVLKLSHLEFIDNAENIVFVGTPGVGKTHLAISIGLKAAQKRHSTYFMNCHKLLANLRKAYDENRLEERLKQYTKYKVLIIDELGFLPISDLEAKILFQLIDKRYEYRSTIITSNIEIEKWHTIFNDSNIANAIIDRIVHHSTLFNIDGNSYRLKDKIGNHENE
jgi:DNA replication protein DnaC